MADLQIMAPERVGLRPAQLQRAYDLLAKWTDTGEVPSASLCVGRRGGVVEPRFFGRQRIGQDAPLGADALFLMASITKPVTATAVMLLLERGKVKLDDRVAEFIPTFGQQGKADVRIRHLLTHTSGLPDMLPDNDRLRAKHRPLEAFVEGACRQPLAFPPGSQLQYQSMGFAVLAEVVHQVEGVTLAECLRRDVFEPLGMRETSLGWRPETKDRIAEVRLSAAQVQAADWNWNSPYWRGFGAPWGGLISAPADMARLCLMLLGGGSWGSTRILGPATVRAMTSNQLATMPDLPEVERRCRPWGLGWRLAWPGQPANFGDLMVPPTYGHWGATGTLCWLDPATETFCLILTTQPQGDDGKFLARISNIVAAAVG
ncbi:MAG TPA: serine hydrolase domain-containing protein [Isosphaeraceae bacterium]|jgi:CubicO group peptidase (beta-lactamase class C family)|nr:serine hydrolase domain-containing protein [Isosphaeraceae bacterium]